MQRDRAAALAVAGLGSAAQLVAFGVFRLSILGLAVPLQGRPRGLGKGAPRWPRTEAAEEGCESLALPIAGR